MKLQIFPEQPDISKDDTLRLIGHIKNRNVVRQWIKTDPSVDDLKRAVLIEVYRSLTACLSPLTGLNRGVYADLVVAIQKRERSVINDRVTALLKDPSVQDGVKGGRK